MTLFEQWNDLINNQTDNSFPDFWKEYSETETRIYKGILGDYKTAPQGTFTEMATKYEADPVIFMGFLDGITTSLNNPIDFKDYDENSEISLDINFEELFFNMLNAEADYLYTLDEWDEILDEDTRMDIIKKYKKSKTVIKEKTPGRNDPCPCGSGKKYKKCCGANK